MPEVASAFVSLVPSAKGFGKATDSAIGGELDGAGKRGGKRFGGGMVAGVKGFIGPMAAVLGGAAALGAFNNLTDLASDFNETLSKSTVIFGKQAGAMEKWASGAAKNLGLSQSKALAAAAGFGDMFSQIGFGGKAAADMSRQVVQASADLGSFSNLDTADVADRMAAAFRGEFDSLQAVIPNINAARVETEALAMTGKKSAKSLTAQEKAAAVLAIVQKDGARAMGDFARTSDGAANKSKIMAARWEDLKTRAGGALLPIKQLALNGFGLLISGLEKLGPLFSKVGEFFKPVIDTVKLFFGTITGKGADVGDLPWMNTVIDAGARVSQVLQQIGDFVTTRVLPGLQRLGQAAQAQIIPALQRLGSFVTGTLIPAFTQVAQYIATNIVPIFVRVAQIIMTNVVPVVASLASFIVGTLVPAVVSIALNIASKLQPILAQLVATFRERILPTLENVLAKFREWQPTIQKVISVVVMIIGKVLEFAAAILGKVLPVVIRFAGFLIENVVGAVAAVIGVVVKIIGKVIEFGGAVVGAVKKVAEFVTGVKEKFGDALTFIKGIPGKVVSALGNLGSLLLNAGKEIIGGLLRGITEKFEDVKSFVGGIGSWIGDHKGPLSYDRKLLIPHGTAIMEGLNEGLRSQMPDLSRTVARVTAGITGPVAGTTRTLGSVPTAEPGPLRLHPDDMRELARLMGQRVTLDGRTRVA